MRLSSTKGAYREEGMQRAPSIQGTCSLSLLQVYMASPKRRLVLSGKTPTSVAASVVCRRQCAHPSPLIDTKLGKSLLNQINREDACTYLN